MCRKLRRLRREMPKDIGWKLEVLADWLDQHDRDLGDPGPSLVGSSVQVDLRRLKASLDVVL